ncbi:MAG: PEP-CTERM sorting domain-containing protein [Fimbriimonadaceae bacterium]
MNNKIAKIVALLAAVTLVAVASARTEPNSFLNKPAKTHAELMKQVQSDDQVMNRFMRHFGMSRKEVLDYFGTLKMDTLKEDGVYLVYNVPETEELRARAIFYKAGTKVWVDQEGTIVLKESCGNPMMRGTDNTSIAMDQPVTANISKPEAAIVVPSGSPTDLVASVLPADVESSALAFPTAAPADVLVSTGGGGFNPAFLIPAAIIPFVVTNRPPDSVPEPMTMVALAAGAGLIIRKRRNKKA